VAREAVSLEELQELAEDLCAANAEQVLALLDGMDVQEAPAAVQAERLAVMGKALLLLEQLEASVAAYREAMALAPERQELLINSGAALLLLGDSAAALEQLRQVELDADAPARQRTAWLRNRATAEERAGDAAIAQQLRLQLLEHSPDAQEPERWLAWAKQWREQGDGAAALQVLQVLRAGGASGSELLEPLAELLEEQGAYREAALVYRELLREGMNSAAEV
jgi:Tfp pilus assembly protein PilF